MTELEDIAQFLHEVWAPKGMTKNKKKVLAMKAAPYTLMYGFLYKSRPYDIIQICVLDHERHDIIDEAHNRPMWGHFQDDTTTLKKLQEGLIQRYQDVYERNNLDFYRISRSTM